MPGMGGATGTSNGLSIISAFHTALIHQWLIVLGILTLLVIVWNVVRARQLQHLAAGGPESSSTQSHLREPRGRQLLRISFGLLWLFDGLLQLQSQMPVSLANNVTAPAAQSSPSWVRHLVSVGVDLWNRHPVTAAAATVWIQVGLGLWLLVAARGSWSRLGGAATAAWAVVVWIFGEAFGAIFAPGLSWLFGAPGAALYYFAAGVLIALPNRLWGGDLIGRITLRGLGLLVLGLGIVQAWPGRGFWQGGATATRPAGAISAMSRMMAGTPQPRLLRSSILEFANFDAAHGVLVNLVIVLVLLVTGLALLGSSVQSGRLRTLLGHLPLLPVLVPFLLVSLAVWVLVQDFGFLGGVGTDPNSMVPMIALLSGGCLALARPGAAGVTALPQRLSLSPGAFARLVSTDPIGSLRVLFSAGALAIVAIGVLPMTLASFNSMADPIVAQSVDGAPQPLGGQAAGFSLTDANGHIVSLHDFAGKTVVLTFLDPVCVSDCPIIAQEIRRTDLLLGADAKRVDFVAIDANPLYRSAAYSNAFSLQEGLSVLSNWSFLSGSLTALQQAWDRYGIQVISVANGSMVAHSDLIYVIDSTGRSRYLLNSDPGAGTAITQSSFEETLLQTIHEVH